MYRFLLALFFSAAVPAFAAPSVEELFQAPRFAYMVISPDGKNIAALAPVAGRQNVVVIDVETRKPRPITAFNERDIVSVSWINSRRVLMRTGSIGVQAFDYRGGALFAIDIDGSDQRLLAQSGDERGGSMTFSRGASVVRTLPGEGDDVILRESVSISRQRAGGIFRVDTRKGTDKSLDFGKPDAGNGESWVVDPKGVPRVLSVFAEGRVRIHYRAGPDAPWQKLDEFSQTEPRWLPLAIAADDKHILVADRRARDKSAIVRYDPATKTFGDILAQHPQVDLYGLVYSDGIPVGVRFDADRPGTAWFDEELARLQANVDSALPDTVNSMNWSRDRSKVLVYAYSDTVPGAYYLLDRKAGKMEWLVDRSPQIKSADLAKMRPVRYTAHDGLEIPAYLTLPTSGGVKNLPLVVMVHGGPWVSGDSWGFNPEVQFLATRGYAVLQPNFRGTTRYGWKHFRSSFGQWGLAMQDDITDGVKWAVEQGIADPRRVCIYGASYGGYATMMGLAKDPDLYRCGVNYVGVTDTNLFLTATWTDYSLSDFLKYTVQEMFGDETKDAERLKATSPVEQAGKIKAPVLMAYGASDTRVPIEHGQRMLAAMERNGAKPVWMVANGEGHGFREMKNIKMFYEGMEKFLAENLK